MEKTLTVPGGFKPSNLILPPELAAAEVEGDLYDICNRIKEVSADLRVVPLIDDPEDYHIAIVEHCRDGVERVVCKVRELDARVLEHLRRLMAVPLSERMVAIEKAERRFEAEEKERQLEELYERVGRPMWTDLERCGFIDRPVSYPKRGIKPTSK